MEKRIIKFRVWDKENNRWYVPTYEAYAGRLEELLINMDGQLDMRAFEPGTTNQTLIHESKFPDRFILMQYTGLKDKEGKEIYEGDVVEYKIKRMFWGRKEEVLVTTVEMQNGIWNITPEWIEAMEESGAEDVGATVEYIKVLGNLYEHPHLMKQEIR